MFLFITAYFEYFGLFASILLSLKNNVAPTKKALVIHGNELFNPTNVTGALSYEEMIHKFNSDFMRQNPITEKESQLRYFDKMIENETD